jgi:tetratricopeptide (TPR) repeat protein
MRLYLRTLLILALLFAGYSNLFAQDVKESEAYKQQKTVYDLASKYADGSIARNSLYNLVAMDPNDASLLDSLAYMYYEYQQFTSCLLVCIDIIKRNPDHLAALEMSAVSYEKLGLKDKALTSYESIYLRNSSIYTLYRIAILQLELGRQGESLTNANILLEKEETKEAKVSISTEQGPGQISLEAAVYNLKGLIESDQGNKEAARASYQQALSIEPEFALAKNNLEELDK